MLTRAEKELGWALSPTEYRTILNARRVVAPPPPPSPDGMVPAFAARAAKANADRRKKGSLFYEVDTDFLQRLERAVGEEKDAAAEVPGRRTKRRTRGKRKRRQQRERTAQTRASMLPLSPPTPGAHSMARLREEYHLPKQPALPEMAQQDPEYPPPVWPHAVPPSALFADWMSSTPSHPLSSLDLLEWSDLVDDTFLFDRITPAIAESVVRFVLTGKRLTKAGLEHVFAIDRLQFSHLATLVIVDCPAVDDRILQLIGRSISQIELSPSRRMSKRASHNPVRSKKGARFHSITLDTLPKIGDDGLRAIAMQHGKHLREWRIRRCPRITSLSIKGLADMGPDDGRLTTLELEECPEAQQNLGDGLSVFLDRCEVGELILRRFASLAESVVFNEHSRLQGMKKFAVYVTDFTRMHIARLVQARKVQCAPSQQAHNAPLNATTPSQPVLTALSLVGGGSKTKTLQSSLTDPDLAPLHESYHTTGQDETRRPTRSLFCRSLLHLDLSHNRKLTDEGVAQVIKKTGKLRTLNVSHTGITATNTLVAAVSINDWLKEIKAVGASIHPGEAFFSALRNAECRNVLANIEFGALEHGLLRDHDAEQVAVGAFAHLPFLQRLYLHSGRDFSDKALKAMAFGSFRLKEIVLRRGGWNISGDALAKIFAGCPQLVHVEIGEARGLANFPNLLRSVGGRTKYPNMRKLVLRGAGAETLTDAGCFTLSRMFPDIRVLDLSGSGAGTITVQSILASCSYLQVLKIKECENVSPRAFARPDLNADEADVDDEPFWGYALTHLDISGCKQITTRHLEKLIAPQCPLAVCGYATSKCHGHGLGHFGLYPSPSFLHLPSNAKARVELKKRRQQRTHAVLHIERFVRGFVGRRLALRLRKARDRCMAIRVQTAWLRYKEQCEAIRRTHRKALKNARFVVRLNALRNAKGQWRAVVVHGQRCDAAIHIQSWIRMLYMQVEFSKFLSEHRRRMAVRTRLQQMVWRIKEHARAKYSRQWRIVFILLTGRVEDANRWAVENWMEWTLTMRRHAMATLIQKNWRANKLRDEIRKRVLATRKRNYETTLHRATLMGKHANSAKLRKKLSFWRTRARLRAALRAVLGKWWRWSRHNVRTAALVRSRASTCIQRAVLLWYLTREEQALRRESATTLQYCWRRKLFWRKVRVRMLRAALARKAARALWFVYRQLAYRSLSTPKHLQARDAYKRRMAVRIQRQFHRWMGFRMKCALDAYRRQRALRRIQSMGRAYIARNYFANRKRWYDWAQIRIVRTYRRYRRRQMFAGIISCLAARRRAKQLAEKHELLRDQAEAQKQRDIKAALDATANVIQRILSMFWMRKKNWRAAMQVLEEEAREREEAKNALDDAKSGKTRFGVEHRKEEQEEWKIALAKKRPEKSIKNLTAAITRRKYNTRQRFMSWVRFQLFQKKIAAQGGGASSKQSKIPELVPISKASLKAANRKRKMEGLSPSKKLLEDAEFRRSPNLAKAKASVKQYQRSAVPILGIVDIKITCGEHEFFRMKEEQKVNKYVDDRLYYECIDRDLTRSHKRPDGTRIPQQGVYIWVCVDRRHCRDLVCSLEIVPLEKGPRAGTRIVGGREDGNGEQGTRGVLSSAASSSAAEATASSATQIVRHARLPFEIHCKREGTTPIVSLAVSGRKESRIRNSKQSPKYLLQTGYVAIPPCLSNLPAMDDAATVKKKQLVAIDTGLHLYAKIIDTSADPRFQKNIAGAADSLESRRLKDAATFAMLEPRDMDRLFSIYCRIQHVGFEARKRSIMNDAFGKVNRATKLRRLIRTVTKFDSSNIVSVDDVHLFLCEEKTPFTEFFWRVISGGYGSDRSITASLTPDMRRDAEQKEHDNAEAVVQLQAQVLAGVFTVSGPGIEPQTLTFSKFVQAVCRFCLMEPEQIGYMVFRLAGPQPATNLVSPRNLVQALRSLHGVAGLHGHARQNLNKLASDIGATGRSELCNIPKYRPSFMMEIYARNRSLLYPAACFHGAFCAKFLGRAFWRRKKTLMHRARKELVRAHLE